MRGLLPAMLALVAAVPAGALPVDRVDSLVGNRIAGAPVDCIEAAEVDTVHLVAGGLVYVMRSPRTIYLNRPASGATFIHDGVVPAVEQNGALLCSQQRVRLFNENSRLPVATAILGPFVPYRRPVTP